MGFIGAYAYLYATCIAFAGTILAVAFYLTVGYFILKLIICFIKKTIEVNKKGDDK